MMKESSERVHLKRLYSQWIILVMSFSCYLVMQAQTVNMSISLVHMLNWTNISDGRPSVCKRNGFVEYTDQTSSPLVAWSPLMQSQILAALMYGMAAMYIPAEMIVSRVPYKWLPLLGTIMASLCDFMIPTFAMMNGYLVVFVQILKTVSHSFIRPSFNLLIEQWVYRKSVHNYMSYGETGIFLSGFFIVLVAGILCATPEFGWEYVFYFTGSMGVIWCMVWFYFVSEYCFPTSFVFGSEPERKKKLQRKKVPWSGILTSTSILAYVLVGMAYYSAFSFNVLLYPLYLKSVFGATSEWITIAAAVPNLLAVYLFVIATFISERFVQSQVFEKVTVRKCCVILGLAPFATVNMFITFTKCRKALSSLIMMIGIGSTSLAASALINLPLDMSPDFAGLLTGIMHTVGALTGSFLPLLMGYLEESDEGIRYWNKVFNALTLLSIVALVLFLAFGSCEIQHWDSNCTIHPYQVKNLRAEMVVPLIYKKSGDSEKIIIPESKRKDLLGTKTVDKSKLADILQSQSMRRTTESKPLKDYSSDDDTLI